MPPESPPPTDAPGGPAPEAPPGPPGAGPLLVSALPGCIAPAAVGVTAALMAAGAGVGPPPGLPLAALCGTAGYLLATEVAAPLLATAARVAVVLGQGQRLDAVLTGPINLWRGRAGRMGLRLRPVWIHREPVVAASPRNSSSLRHRVLHEGLRSRLAVEHAAPFVVLSLAALRVIAVVVVTPRLGPLGPLGASPLRLTAAIGVACGLLAAVQRSFSRDTVGGVATPGSVLRGLRKGGHGAEVTIASTLLLRIDAAGVAPEAWPPGLIRCLTEEPPEGGRGALDASQLALRALVAGQESDAVHHAVESWQIARDVEAHGDPALRLLVGTTAATVVALGGGDPTDARRILDEATGGASLRPFDRIAVACVLSAEGAPADQVRAARDEALEWLERMPQTGSLVAINQVLRELTPKSPPSPQRQR